MVVRRKAALSSFGATAPPARYSSRSCSSRSETVSTRESRASLASLSMDSGIGASRYSIPNGSLSHNRARMATRSTTPMKPSASPMGSATTAGAAPSFSSIWLTTRRNSEPTRSILFTNAILGTPYLLA